MHRPKVEHQIWRSLDQLAPYATGRCGATQQASTPDVEVRVLGLPAELIYLFSVWLLLIVGARWFASRLGADDRQGGPP